MKQRLTPREQKSKKTKLHIQETAKALFRTYGFQKVTVNMIVEEAGISVGTFYHYFKSKQELLEAVMFTGQQLFTPLEDVNFDTDDCADTILRQYSNFFEHLSKMEITAVNSLMGINGGNKTMIAPTHPSYRAIYTLIKGFQESGRIKSDVYLDEIKEALSIVVFGSIYHWILNDRSYNLEEKVHIYLRRMLSAYLTGNDSLQN